MSVKFKEPTQSNTLIIIPVFNEIHIAKLFTLLEKNVATKFRVLICYDEDSDKTLTAFNENSFNFEINYKKRGNYES